MKARISPILLLILVITVFPIFPQQLETFDRLVDFSITLKDLNLLSEARLKEIINDKKLVIINGSVASILIINKEENNFAAELELIQGEWEGIEEVKIFRCIVRLNGAHFAPRLQVQRSREKHPDAIELNSSILVVGKLVEIKNQPNESPLPVLEGIYIRQIR